jgi:hypothetical protein
MRRNLKNRLGKSSDPKNIIVEEVLKECLLENATTGFNYDENKFTIYFPIINRNILKSGMLCNKYAN